MNSCLYKCSIAHRRSSPRKHSFKYSIFMFYLDLDELEMLDKSKRLLGHNRFAPYSFHDSDHYQVRSLPIRGSIEAFLKEKGLHDEIGKIHLLTHLRTWGHVFNPVSFYFVSNRDGESICSIAEVGNTFNEQKMFLLPSDSKGISQAVQKKEFYVSPFSDLDTSFHFRLSAPQECLRLSINQSKEGKTYFRTALSGNRAGLTDWNLALYAIRFPLITLNIVFAIHWQAFVLYLKGIRARPKAANPHQQTGVRPYIVNHNHPIY
ncbi:MAG: DUF1365 domain-containing protein [Opitutales bacterium]|nr:DUF1365 domain-containing protein [Opitutales bacterium]MBT5814302.1 DUF1365 domain-containing protein [Opitutales bacterium]